MSLDDIKLSPLLVKKMYEKTLVVSSFANDENTEKKPKVETQKTILPDDKKDEEINYLGKNNKHILILVNEKDHKFLSDNELSFLMNILSACNITMADAALVNSYNNADIVYEKLIKTFAPSTILFIGTEPQALGFPVLIPMYQVQAYNKQQYLCAPSLQKLSSNKEEKKQLWVALKKIFSI
jgi:hypothetical protein